MLIDGVVRRGLLVSSLMLGALAAVLPVAGARAAVFNVTRFDDPAPTTCAAADCTLREAVIAADSAHGQNTILVPAGVYTLELRGSGPGAADLNILGTTVTIEAVGGQATVDADSSRTKSRVFYVFSGGHATFEHVTVRNGAAPRDTDKLDRGGGIRVDSGGSLTMSDGFVTDNTVTDRNSVGGGIYNDGQLTLVRVTVEDNSTGVAFGGGVYTDVNGHTTITDSTIEDNAATYGAALSGTGSMEVDRSLIRDNGGNLGGGAYLYGCGSSTFSYDTFAGNVASGRGGAIRVANSSASLFHVTMSGNEADQNGGGVAVNAPGGCATNLYLRDTIVAGNHSAAGGSPDCLDETNTGGDVISEGHNIVGDDAGCNLTASSGDRLGSPGSPVYPRLGLLAFNGGPTMTMALLPGGPAVGAADPRYCGATDQRGWVIAHDGDSGGCDIGAYELFRPPHDQTAPKIKGKHLPGVRLFCWRGTWSGATPMTFAYRWLRDGKTIAGATGSHYRVSAADRRHALRCAVTATNVVSSASAVSAAVRILASRT